MRSTLNLNEYTSSLNNAVNNSSIFHQQCQQQRLQHQYIQQSQTHSLAPTLTTTALTMSSSTAVLHNQMQNNQKQKNIEIDSFHKSLPKNVSSNFEKSLLSHQNLTSSINKKLSVDVFPTQNLKASSISNNYSSSTTKPQKSKKFKVIFFLID